MTRLILSTSNVMNSGPTIIRKPGNDRTNLELINSLRNNLLAAQQDYTPPISTTSSNSAEDGEVNGISDRIPVSLWTARDGDELYVPRIDWPPSGLAEERSQYDITVKLFFLPSEAVKNRAEHTKRAIQLVLKELGVGTIDLLIVSFPGMSFDGDCEWEADKMNGAQGCDKEEMDTWPVFESLYTQGTVKKLGLAEFGSEKLTRFLSKVKVKPAVDQINVKDCCNVPPPLIKLAKKEHIDLLTHHDCTNILPSGMLSELLGQRDAENAAGLERGIDFFKGDITSQWVIKYTAVVRDRGVVENKGYFAEALLEE